MWPMFLDMSRDECKRLLRRLELEAYSGVVTALRAQGFLSKEKRKLLQDLASALSISLERHRAEVRRAVNDEKLATIAEHMAGPNTSSEWAIEGRRLIPLMPRLVPQTAFTVFANKMANITASENAKLPLPSRTARTKGTREEHTGIVEHHHRQPVGISSCNLSTSMHVPRSTPSQLHLGKRSAGSQQLCHEGIPKRPRFSDSAHVPRQVKVSPVSAQPVPVKRLEEQVSQLPSHIQSNSKLQPVHQSLSALPQERIQQPVAQSQPLSSVRIQSQPQSHSPSQPPTPLQVQLVTHNHTHSQSALDPSSPPVHSHPVPVEQQQQQQQTPPQPRQLPHQQLQLLQHLQHQEQPQQRQQQPKQQEQRLQQEEEQQQHLLLNAQPGLSPSPASPLVRPSVTGTPVKITLTSGVSRTSACSVGLTNTTPTITTTSAPTTQKVIIVQSAAATASSGQPGILQRSLSVPMASRSASLVISGHGNSTPVTPTTIVTISTNPGASGMSIPGRVLGRPAPVPDDVLRPVHPTAVRSLSVSAAPGAVPRLRPKAATAVLSPSRLRPRAASIVIPVTPNAAAGVPGVGLRPTRAKHEGGAMKIVPIPTPALSAAKILPKPAYSTAGSASSGITSSSSNSNNNNSDCNSSSSSTTHSGPAGPVYRMSSTTSTITMMTRTVPATSVAGTGARMVTVSATTLPALSVAPAAGRPAKAASGKPNVIVVQKGSATAFPRGVALSGAGRVQGLPQSLQEMLSKVVTSKTLAASASGSQQGITGISMHKAGGPQGLNLPVVSGQAGNVLVLDLSHENVNKNMVLADILQASGITGDAESPPTKEKGAETDSGENSTTQPPPNEQAKQRKTAAQSQQKAAVVEVIGELDPQTGIYSLHPNPISGEPDGSLVSDSDACVGVSCGEDSSTSGVDIFNTALASADINLDSFQYMEEVSGAGTRLELPSSGSVNAKEHSRNEPLHFLSQSANEPVAVTVEPSHIDTTAMHIEDFTSQKMQEPAAME